SAAPELPPPELPPPALLPPAPPPAPLPLAFPSPQAPAEKESNSKAARSFMDRWKRSGVDFIWWLPCRDCVGEDSAKRDPPTAARLRLASQLQQLSGHRRDAGKFMHLHRAAAARHRRVQSR